MTNEETLLAQQISKGLYTKLFLVTLKTAVALQLRRTWIEPVTTWTIRTTVLKIEWPMKFKQGEIGNVHQIEPVDKPLIPVIVVATALDPKTEELHELSPDFGGAILFELRSDLVLSRQAVKPDKEKSL